MTDYVNEYVLSMTVRETEYPCTSYDITSPQTVVECVNKVYDLENAAEEWVVIITMNTKHVVNGIFSISHGTISSTLINPSEIFKRVWLNNSSAFVLVHNHPSGNPTPSVEDEEVTKRVKKAADIMGISFLDHVIIGRNSYKSLKEVGCLK